ncbi:beta-ketoacyl synthase N-terminal-like domain-containing protein [Streptomyces sioyaensis]
MWQLLAEGKDAVGEVPAGRWDTTGLYDRKRPSTPVAVRYRRWSGPGF